MGCGWRISVQCRARGYMHPGRERETAGGAWHQTEGHRDRERWRKTKKGGGDLQGWEGQEWTTSQSGPWTLPTCAFRCCCTSSAMPTTTCWASMPPSASPCARGAATAEGSAGPLGCVPASQAGGALTAACRSAHPTVAAMAPVPR